MKVENFKVDQQILNKIAHDKIEALETKIHMELNEMKSNISTLGKRIELFKINQGAEVDKNVNTNQAINTSQSKNYHNNTLLKYRIRISGLPEAPSDLKYHERQTHEHNIVSDVFKFMNLGNIPVSDCFRLGKFNSEQKRPCLLYTSPSPRD